MTNDEIEALYQSMTKDYQLCKQVSHNDAVEYVRSDVMRELEKRGLSFLDAAVHSLQVRKKLLHGKKK